MFRALLLLAFSVTIALAEDDLPRVLILGDSVYQQPAQEVAQALAGQAEVHFPNFEPGEVRSTWAALEKLDSWLAAEEDWDLIYFNFGLGDLIHRAPGMKSFRVMPLTAGGIRTTDETSYEENLRKVVDRLKSTRAKLVWSSTTPIRHSATKVFEMGSEICYNAIASKVMAAAKVPVFDMYSHVKKLIDMDKPAGHNADPFHFDKQPLHPPIVDRIRQELRLPPKAG